MFTKNLLSLALIMLVSLTSVISHTAPAFDDFDDEELNDYIQENLLIVNEEEELTASLHTHAEKAHATADAANHDVKLTPSSDDKVANSLRQHAPAQEQLHALSDSFDSNDDDDLSDLMILSIMDDLERDTNELKSMIQKVSTSMLSRQQEPAPAKKAVSMLRGSTR
mmetsp:Transcript_29053/g.47994  ORF Transcript_29053/g.47994 Transcript_29053/m.47994 type:complete len:167 (+) Transcript_29053:88-588(+)